MLVVWRHNLAQAFLSAVDPIKHPTGGGVQYGNLEALGLYPCALRENSQTQPNLGLGDLLPLGIWPPNAQKLLLAPMCAAKGMDYSTDMAPSRHLAPIDGVHIRV